MRIIGGKNRGTALAAVGKGDAAAHLRPTTDRVRESIFNLLAHGGYDDPITDARVLDLFAGTGAMGLEALSRGAREAVFVDDGIKARGLLRRNIEILKLADQSTLLARDATRIADNSGQPCDLVFLDPPYGKGLGERALAACVAGNWIAKDALILWEENTAITPPPGFRVVDSRRYGDTSVHILTYQAPV